MEISIMRMVELDDLKHKGTQAAIDKIIEDVKYDIADKIEILERDYNNYPDSKAVVCVTTKYLSDGIKREPSDEQRNKLSALSQVHKMIMDKMKDNTGLEDILLNAQLSNMVLSLIKEVENETTDKK